MPSTFVTNYAIYVWVAAVIKWIEVDEKLRMKKAWHELSPAFYAWLAHNAVPYDSPKATSGCDKFAKVRYEDFARCITSVTGRNVKRVKASFHFDDNDFTYPDESSCPSTNLEDSEAEALEG